MIIIYRYIYIFLISDFDIYRFDTGNTTILTLKDKNVLDEEEDTLVNMNILDDERAEKVSHTWSGVLLVNLEHYH